ncbi:MAG: hypothetical protein AAF333_11670 [Planctomycetota bacterium]
MSSAPRFRLPDLLVGLFCVALLIALAAVALTRNRHVSRGSQVVPTHLRSIHQAMLIYSTDNGSRLPGLNPDGSLLTNDPAERYGLLTDGGYLAPELLVSPLDPDPSAEHSFALLDIGEPGARRDAWTTDPRPDAPVLAERRATLPGRVRWSGWVMFHRLALASDAGLPEHHPSPRLRTRYTLDGPFNEADDLFAAEGADDAHLIAAE